MSRALNVTDSYAIILNAFVYTNFRGKLEGCIVDPQGFSVPELDVSETAEGDFILDGSQGRYLLRKEQIEFIH